MKIANFQVFQAELQIQLSWSLPKNAQEVFNMLYDMKEGTTINGGDLSTELDGISVTKDKKGYHLIINNWFKRNTAIALGFDKNNSFTIEKVKSFDGKEDLILYKEYANNNRVIPCYVHNDAFITINGPTSIYKPTPFQFGEIYSVGKGKDKGKW